MHTSWLNPRPGLQDFPVDDFGYYIAVVFVASLTGQSYAQLVVQLATPNTSLAVLGFMFLMLLLFPFASGIFLLNEKVWRVPGCGEDPSCSFYTPDGSARLDRTTPSSD
jgi:hypothetical protein